MKAKGYFGVLIIILIALVLRHNDAHVANQQILLQFNTSETTSEITEQTLTTLKRQLTDAGADNIIVEHLPNGELKITYHSIFDVDYIKSLLQQENVLYAQDDKSDDQFPTKNNYELDIFEIQKGVDSDLSLAGLLIPTSPQKSDSSFHQNHTFFDGNLDNPLYSLIEVAFQVNQDVQNKLNKTSRDIPEVRAGPIA
ncbi:hypothetical protein [Winogradskyella ursingii]|uniref:hypothetical protein n=1 Tax=Winogradskyella ursingii TaxID=2686079 RepID=UPI0015C85F32|nr:hypothetical protein [Winogradskyella ursingii]